MRLLSLWVALEVMDNPMIHMNRIVRIHFGKMWISEDKAVSRKKEIKQKVQVSINIDRTFFSVLLTKKRRKETVNRIEIQVKI